MSGGGGRRVDKDKRNGERTNVKRNTRRKKRNTLRLRGINEQKEECAKGKGEYTKGEK